MKSGLRYFVYARKSSDETAARQVMSLPAQMREIREIVKREGLIVVDSFEESKTAKQPGRPIFDRMLKRIEDGDANGLLCWDVDRLYRNPADEGRVRWMLQQGIIKSIRTPGRSYSPSDAGLLMAVDGGRGIDFIISHRRNVMRGVREKLLRGEWPGQRPFGYVYDHDKRNIAPDPKRAKIVETVFEEFASGRKGLLAISDRLVDLGVVTTNGKPWTKSLVHKMLTNRLYTGVMVWNGETFEGKYRPIISADLFAKVQKTLKDRSKPRRTRTGHNFPFCGIFRCTCGSMITAQWAKGRGGLYRYYRCTRKAGACGERYLQESAVMSQILRQSRPLAITSDEAAEIYRVVNEIADNDAQGVEKTSSEIGGQQALVQQKLNKLTRAYLDELIDEDSYRQAKDDLIVEKTRLRDANKRIQRNGSNFWIEPTKEVINALEQATKLQIEQSPEEIAALVKKIGTNPLISQRNVSFGFASLYQEVAQQLPLIRSRESNSYQPRSGENSRGSTWCTV